MKERQDSLEMSKREHGSALDVEAAATTRQMEEKMAAMEATHVSQMQALQIEAKAEVDRAAAEAATAAAEEAEARAAQSTQMSAADVAKYGSEQGDAPKSSRIAVKKEPRQERRL